ncbi:hypothetical protein [Phenylobacterium immobile]|uniref:hypothetical protein n=1 Tax=Phenylobacterium immobile TaxID=21 RepID=UPI000B1AF6C0|nr:hypothetical protein [Phenylobacterium immobile]
MAARKPPPSLAQRTSVAEWAAAAAGLVLTILVVGYTLWEGLSEREGPPRLSAVAEQAVQAGQTYVLPVVVRNAGPATAADVEVLAVLARPGLAPEERRATFAYVPGNGEARGGLVFEQDPTGAVLTVQGFADP